MGSIRDYAEWLSSQHRAFIAPVTDEDVRQYAAHVGLDLDGPGGDRHAAYCREMVYLNHCIDAVENARRAGTAPPKRRAT